MRKQKHLPTILVIVVIFLWGSGCPVFPEGRAEKVSGQQTVAKPVGVYGQVVLKQAFTPLVITTAGLSITGRRFFPLVIRTEGLRIAGRRFIPLSLTTKPLSITGRRFNPVTIRTPGLTITGGIRLYQRVFVKKK
ncbi:MAG: hypothetical protein JXA62_01575 [Candidatus Aminicenantes bacterium]|nr:hypothetical protein [Candidatus Aminicenantes bacterium]